MGKGLRNRLVLLCTVLVLVLGGCASVVTRLPIPDTAQIDVETEAQERLAFARYLKMRKRLDKVSAPILTTNADLCTKTRDDFGITTHTEKSYPKHLRAAAKRRVAAGDTHTVLFVRDGRSSHGNGIKSGDILIGNTGKPISTRDKSLQDTNILHVRRAGEDIYIQAQANRVCDYGIILKMSGVVNAYANGKSIIVTTAMMDFAGTDEELALVVGHELAHNTMKHVRKAIWNTVISGFATRTTRPFESEADYVGLYYMARAGYTLDNVEVFWKKLGVQHPKSIVRAKTHPVTPERLLAIRMAIEEIKTKRAAGKKLVPNFKPGQTPNYAQ